MTEALLWLGAMTLGCMAVQGACVYAIIRQWRLYE